MFKPHWIVEKKII